MPKLLILMDKGEITFNYKKWKRLSVCRHFGFYDVNALLLLLGSKNEVLLHETIGQCTDIRQLPGRQGSPRWLLQYSLQIIGIFSKPVCKINQPEMHMRSVLEHQGNPTAKLVPLYGLLSLLQS